MATTTIVRVYQYCAGGDARDLEVPALIVGDLAIHRPVYWFKDGEPYASEKGWAVTHVPSKLSVTRAMPESLQRWGASRNDIKAWAVEFQRRAAPIFDALRAGEDVDRDTAISFYTMGRGVVVGARAATPGSN